jgi:hypothetical protein
VDLNNWLLRLAAEIDTDDLELDPKQIQALLDVARDCAHEVEKVAAPLSTFLVGVAVGRGQPLEEAAAQATALARSVRHEADDDAHRTA